MLAAFGRKVIEFGNKLVQDLVGFLKGDEVPEHPGLVGHGLNIKVTVVFGKPGDGRIQAGRGFSEVPDTRQVGSLCHKKFFIASHPLVA